MTTTLCPVCNEVAEATGKVGTGKKNGTANHPDIKSRKSGYVSADKRK